jgi:hypothetical protein
VYGVNLKKPNKQNQVIFYKFYTNAVFSGLKRVWEEIFHFFLMRIKTASISRWPIGLHFFKMGALVFCLVMAFESLGQSYKITLGPSKIGENEAYTITLSAINAELENYSNFPNIPGFSKAGTSSSSSFRNVNGQTSNETSIIQNYLPEKQGSFKLPPFQIKVSGTLVKSPGATIVVGPPVEQKSADPFGANPFAYDPFEDFFGGSRSGEIKAGKADALFSIQTDKEEIWAGEGLNVTMSFLVSDDNSAELDFYDLGNQLADAVKKAKPANCWEENFGIEEIVPRKVRIGKKQYTEYRFYQATWFPLTAKSFTIPQLKWNMVQYKTTLGSGFFGTKRNEEIKPFYSKPIPIKVKELPAHPMRGNVSVGNFQMSTKLDRNMLGLNQGVALDIGIKGEGNISYVPEPQKEKTELLDIYPPNTRQNIQRAGGKITGEKVFSYLLVPKEIGKMEVGKTFYWVYFNTRTGRYDTLRPAAEFKVLNRKKADSQSSISSEDAFFGMVENADKTLLTEEKEDPKITLWVNVSLGFMALTTLLLSFWKRSS